MSTLIFYSDKKELLLWEEGDDQKTATRSFWTRQNAKPRATGPFMKVGYAEGKRPSTGIFCSLPERGHRREQKLKFAS